MAKKKTFEILAECYGKGTGATSEQLVSFLEELDRVGVIAEWNRGHKPSRELEALKRSYRRRFGTYRVDGREYICISEPWKAAEPGAEPEYRAYAMDPDARIEPDPEEPIDALHGRVGIMLLRWKSRHWPEEAPMLADADWEHPDSCEATRRRFTVWDQLGK